MPYRDFVPTRAKHASDSTVVCSSEAGGFARTVYPYRFTPVSFYQQDELHRRIHGCLDRVEAAAATASEARVMTDQERQEEGEEKGVADDSCEGLEWVRAHLTEVLLCKSDTAVAHMLGCLET